MIKVAFYRGKGNWANKLIRWWTRSEYSHVELFFADKNISWSSSGRDKGVRFKKIIFAHDKWDMITIPCTAEAEDKIYKWCEEITKKNHGYAWKDIFAFVLSPLENDKARFFCSEAVLDALIAGRLFRGINSAKVYPGMLRDVIAACLSTVGELID